MMWPPDANRQSCFAAGPGGVGALRRGGPQRQEVLLRRRLRRCQDGQRALLRLDALREGAPAAPAAKATPSALA